MSEEREEPTATEDMDRSLEEREGGPTSIDVTDSQDSIGDVFPAEPQEEKVQEQNTEIEQVQEESRINKREQKRRMTSYLSNISKQVERHGNQMNKVTMMIQSLQKQKQTKSTTGSGIGQTQFHSVKQVKTQISQLQKQVAQIQNDIQRIRTASIVRTKTKSKSKKLSASAASTAKSRSKKSKSLKRNKSQKK
jgi:hypothetical protein